MQTWHGGTLAAASGVARWAGRVGRGVTAVLLDALLPPQCLTCDQPVRVHGTLCGACFLLTGFITAPFCGRCAGPVLHHGQLAPGPGGTLACHRCHAAPPAWERARAALRYDDQGRRLVLALKYADRLELARPLARMMARAGSTLLAEADLLVPVPLHRGRLRWRRYNQSALLAGALAGVAGRPACQDALVRVRRTPSLGRLGRAARAEAVGGAFTVRAGRRAVVEGARVLLVDDVLTSGATAGECARVLRAAGARAVDLVVAARVPDPALD